MSDKLYQPPSRVKENAHCSSFQDYQKLHKLSLESPQTFWGEICEKFFWKKKPSDENFLKYNFNVEKGAIKIEWCRDGITNVCFNMLDNHIEKGSGDKIAFYWEGNDPDDMSKITYQELLLLVCRFSNYLKSQGISKGDRIAIYMPMTVEIIVAMLACARIGAVHSVVFGGFSANSLAERILDSNCSIVVTADGVWRGLKLLNLKEIVDGALAICSKRGYEVKRCVVLRHLTGECNQHKDVEGKRPYSQLNVSMNEGVDIWWHDAMEGQSDSCSPEWVEAEHPLFMLYTSGSTGKPKGVLHTTAGYMLYAATTFKYSFDYHPGDVYWCTADVGWITGHSYVCYGPLANCATSVVFEGTPFHPSPARCWQIVDKYSVSKFYTAPTAIRALMKYGDRYLQETSRASLKILGTVGEPINPEAWLWYHRVVGNSNCSIVDTFWQTETGGHVITPLPGATPTKPGSATFPFFGIEVAIMTEEGKLLEGEGEGYLVFTRPWPGIMRTVYGDHQRFETTYFKKFPGYYCTGDGARRDSDNYIWITGRIDDMLNVSGHLLSTSEVESALIEHEKVAENAVVSVPHSIKGEALYCFVTLKEGYGWSDEMCLQLKNIIREKIGPFAQPDIIQEAPVLPKTRSGKIMRRVLRKIAAGDRNLGDVSTMADESVVDVLFRLRPDSA